MRHHLTSGPLMLWQDVRSTLPPEKGLIWKPISEPWLLLKKMHRHFSDLEEISPIHAEVQPEVGRKTWDCQAWFKDRVTKRTLWETLWNEQKTVDFLLLMTNSDLLKGTSFTTAGHNSHNCRWLRSFCPLYLAHLMWNPLKMGLRISSNLLSSFFFKFLKE